MDGVYKEFKLSAPLNQYIDCVWKESYCKYFDKHERSFLIVPDNTIELVFTTNRVKRNLIHSSEDQHRVKSHLSGLKTIPQHITLNGEVLLSIRFKPYGLYRFTSIDFKDTINASIEPRMIFGKDIDTLEAQLFNCRTELEQLLLIENFFIKRLYHNNIKEDLVFDFFIKEILQKKGNISISELAKEMKISKKTIERKFISNLGITPKKYGRIVRLFHTLKIPKEQVSLTTVGLNNGFYDQAHFIKEVKAFTGMTPKEYFKIDRTIQTNIFLS